MAVNLVGVIPTEHWASFKRDYPQEIVSNQSTLNQCELIEIDDEQAARNHGCLGILFWQDDRLMLQSFADSKFNPLVVDWTDGKMDYRRRHGGRGELIAKAVGVKKDFLPTIIDCTAGLGQDSAVLAAIGCHVTSLERSRVVGALLWDALRRARVGAATGEFANRITFELCDSIRYLQLLSENQRPEVVYCDPMFPERKKSALVKKEMRVFKTIVGEDNDAAQLLLVALQTAKKRVVVKRPRKAPPVIGPKPNHVVEGRACRFDVYFIV